MSGSFRRVQLQEDPVDFPLTAELTVPGVGTLSQTLTGCSVKGTKTRKVTCVPGPIIPTNAPTAAPMPYHLRTRLYWPLMSFFPISREKTARDSMGIFDNEEIVGGVMNLLF